MAKGMQPIPSEDSNNNAPNEVGNDQNSGLPRSRIPLSLPLAIPLYTPPIEDVQEGGEYLFRNYLFEEFQRENIGEPELNLHPEDGEGIAHHPFIAQAQAEYSAANNVRYRGATAAAVSTPEGYKNYAWTCYGRDLRKIADAFADSSHGARVRQQAAETILTDITQERFWHLLNELFSEGVSTERLIALFYYCALLLIRSQKIKDMMLTTHLFTWSLNFVRDRVCHWVYEHGGWDRVLGRIYTFLMKLGFIGLVIVGITCGWIYIRKNL